MKNERDVWCYVVGGGGFLFQIDKQPTTPSLVSGVRTIMTNPISISPSLFRCFSHISLFCVHFENLTVVKRHDNFIYFG